ncbi:hypothetical protein [Nocardiopsis sp. CNR-923]|uniref:hypothetical protein n=1 Tax=Nocardiopsis sp. CNR-923 TaxID=1904965 RepID=UPI001300D05D|nr:hypothetical protein [Nocardiopsis sp. CNR-923]
MVEAFVSLAREHGLVWVFAAPDEGVGVEGRVAWLVACGFVAVDDSGEAWPVMGRETRP